MNKWDNNEDLIIREHYPTGGPQACAPLLPKRTEGAIRQRAGWLGVRPAPRGEKWSEAEDSIIREHYPTGGPQACVSLLPKRTEGAIRQHALQLGVKSPPRGEKWSEAEDSLIREHYPTGGPKACVSSLPKRTVGAIKNRARLLGVRSVPREEKWSEAEDSLIREHYPIGGYKDCISLLPKRTKYGIAKRARELGVQYGEKWTEEQDNIIRDVYPKGGVAKCREFLPNRSAGSISDRAQHLMVRRELSSWSAEEDSIIKEHYPNGPAKCLSMLPHRCKRSLSLRARKLGVECVRKGNWEEEELEILHEYFPSQGAQGCLEKMPYRTLTSIQVKASNLGIRQLQRKPNRQQKSQWNMWTQEEKAILRKFYPREGAQGCLEYLPGRSLGAIKHHARAILPPEEYKRIKGWTEEENRLLIEHYPGKGAAGCHIMLNHRSLESIRNQASRLGVSYIDTRWTPDEEKMLLSTDDRAELIRAFPNRTATAILDRQAVLRQKLNKGKKVHNTGISKAPAWTPEEDEILKEHYPRIGLEVCAMLPGRTLSSIKQRASQKGYKRTK